MRAELYWLEGLPFSRLAILPRPRGGDWLEDEIRSLRQAGVDVLVSLLTADETRELALEAEARCCRAVGVEFVSFPISDRDVPDSLQAIAALAQKLTGALMQGKAVAVHCRQGVGRSSLVAACILVGLGDTLDAALTRLSTARGCPVPETDEQRHWLTKFNQRRQRSAHG